MKILYVVSQYPSLTETFITREMAQLVDNGHRVEVGILRSKQESKLPKGIEVSDIKCLRMPLHLITIINSIVLVAISRPLILLRCLTEILIGAAQKPKYLFHLAYILVVCAWVSRQIRNDGIDFIRAHFLHNEAIAAYWISLLIERPYSITAHTRSVRHGKTLTVRAVQSASFTVGITKDMVNLLSEMGSRNIILVRNGVNLEEFVYMPTLNVVSEPTILAIGSLLPLKGFNLLIQACGLLKKRGVSFRCVILGEGTQRPALEKSIDELSLKRFVELPGAFGFETVKDYIYRSALLVMPSVFSKLGSDGLPTVIIESMAAGLPVIATAFAGIPDLVIHGKTGLLIHPGNVRDLADGIEELLRNKKLRERLRLSARKTVEIEYDIKNSVLILDSEMKRQLNLSELLEMTD